MNRKKDPRGGALPQKRGAQFEKEISRAMKLLKKYNIWAVDKKATQMNIQPTQKIGPQKKDGRMLAYIVYAKSSTVDFEGYECKTGKHIAFEAKVVRREQFMTPPESWLEQVRYLGRAAASGCIAFFLIYHDSKNNGQNVRLLKADPEWRDSERLGKVDLLSLPVVGSLVELHEFFS